MKILLSWTGRDSDPEFVDSGGIVVVGSQFQFLKLPEWREYFDLHILFAAPSTAADGESLKAALKRERIALKQEIRTLKLEDPTDYAHIRALLVAEFETLYQRFDRRSTELTVLVTPGTPQMRMTWFVLQALGILDGRMIQTQSLSAAEEFGVSAWKEVDAQEVLALDELRELLATEPLLSKDDTTQGTELGLPLKAHVRKLEVRLIKEMLDWCNGNQSEAARRLGIDRNTLRSKLSSA